MGVSRCSGSPFSVRQKKATRLAHHAEVSLAWLILDCYWVGSLIFKFLEPRFSTEPTTVETFCKGMAKIDSAPLLFGYTANHSDFSAFPYWMLIGLSPNGPILQPLGLRGSLLEIFGVK